MHCFCILDQLIQTQKIGTCYYVFTKTKNVPTKWKSPTRKLQNKNRALITSFHLWSKQIGNLKILFKKVKAYDYLNIEASKYPSSTKYEVISQLKKIYNNAPIYSMKKRHPAQKPDDASPGPGKYHLGKNKNL